MKLYQSIGPNPRVTTMYIAERGIKIDRIMVDIQAGENRQPDMLAINPSGSSPFLLLDNATVLPDSVAICEYLEEICDGPKLFGDTAEQRSATRAKMRTIDQNIVVPMANGFRSAEGLPMFESRMFCCPEASDGNKAYARDGLIQLDKGFGDGPWLMGERFSMADILLFCFAEFGPMVGQMMPDECSNLKAWRARTAERDSAKISADPNNGI